MPTSMFLKQTQRRRPAKNPRRYDLRKMSLKSLLNGEIAFGRSPKDLGSSKSFRRLLTGKKQNLRALENGQTITGVGKFIAELP